ncbi:hypothetical protein I6H07_06205 [Hafnia alvei]|nr:hypothetical protein [Hafnia alvei]MBI0275427.1 hypothetical protein [Hafnia alvei]PNK98579.1 hypothetical protein CEQ28_013790 [Hafnia alvei]
MFNDVCIILNGPPGCGKDTLANLLAKAGYKGILKREFKHALYKVTSEHFGIDYDQLLIFARCREQKDTCRLPVLGNRTPREALIYVSEEVMKPLHGEDYFGGVEAETIEAMRGNTATPSFDVVYSDGGFIQEAVRVSRTFKKTVVVRLHREGFTFMGDSRNYVYPIDVPNMHSCDLILEDGKEQQALHELTMIYETLKQYAS